MMKRTQALHLAALLTVAVLVRALLFDHVGIWGDYGFYQYDARLILEGKAPFADFLGRSPVMVYTYAWARDLFGNPTILIRIYVITWWVLTAAPVYLIARDIKSHRAGLLAGAVFLLTPFAIVYGMWGNTMGAAAFFATTAIYVRLRTDAWYWMVPTGALLGIAYLSRRSIIVVLFGVILYEGYEYYTDHDSLDVRALQTTTLSIIVVSAAFLATLLVTYAAIVGWNVQQTLALFEVHTGNLFFTYGRGGWPLLGTQPEPVSNGVVGGHVPILNDLCQTCGAWTARTFAKTLLIIIPGIGILAYYFRDATDNYFDRKNFEYLVGIHVVLGLYAVVRTLLSGYYLRTGAIVSLALFVVVAYRSPALDRDLLYDRKVMLVLIVLVGMTGGYLYRNQVLHTYYFMDFWAGIAVLAGLLYDESWPTMGRVAQVTLVVAIVLGAVVGFGGAYPLANVVVDDNAGGWFTMDNTAAYQEDINERTAPGETVFVASPNYVANSHARMVNDNPRIHMVTVRYEDNGPGEPIYETIQAGLESGDIRYVVLENNTKAMLEWHSPSAQAFESNYCRIEEADGLYAETHAALYEYQPDCPSPRQPPETRGAA